MPKAKTAEKSAETVQSTKKVPEGKKAKDFVVEQKDGTCLYHIRFKQGGEVPKELKGLYTNDIIAKEAIQRYQDKR